MHSCRCQHCGLINKTCVSDGWVIAYTQQGIIDMWKECSSGTKVERPSCGLLDGDTDRTVANWSADWWEVFLRATGGKRLGRNAE